MSENVDNVQFESELLNLIKHQNQLLEHVIFMLNEAFELKVNIEDTLNVNHE